jgi:peptidoglycan/LPS O-acetylase OafA/YrhL
MWFYLVFAAALVFFRRSVAAVTVFLVVTSLGALVHPGGAFLSIYTNPIVLEFVAGAWLGILYARGRTLPVWAAIVFVFVALGSHQALKPVLSDVNRFWVFGIPAFSFVALFLAFEKRVHWAVLVTLGNASYSIYLTHVFGVPIAIKMLMFADAGRRLQGDLACVFVVLICLAVGIAAYGWLEVPLTRAVRNLRAFSNLESKVANPQANRIGLD